MRAKIKKEIGEFCLLLKNVPAVTVTVFVMSVFAMNLLANKSISLPVDWLALDCGIIVSWFAFLTMDILTKHFGPKASTEISVLATALNLLFCFLMFLGSRIPGEWGESFVPDGGTLINTALDNTFGGTWYVVFGSTVAFLVSSLVNNFTNHAVGKAFSKTPDSLKAFTVRAYVSTALGQFADNLVFSLLVSHVFFAWTLTQCITCAACGMVAELLFECVFSWAGYKACLKWKRDGVGKQYLEYIEGEK